MAAERRALLQSSSTIYSESVKSGSCWEELINYMVHLIRKSRHEIIKLYKRMNKTAAEEVKEI